MPYIIRKYEKQKEGRCGNMGRRLGGKNGIRMGPTKNVRNTQFRFLKGRSGQLKSGSKTIFRQGI